MAKIKAVIFDAGGILHTVGSGQIDDIKRTLGLSDEQMSDLWEAFFHDLLTDRISEEELWEKVSKRYKVRKADKSENLLIRFLESSIKKSDDVYEIVEELKANDIKVMILSNVTRGYAEVQESAGHYDPFHHKILSYKVGIAKPDPEIYKMALKELDVKPEEAVFVDDYEKNVKVAEKLGIIGIVFKNAKQLKKDLASLMTFLNPT